VNNGAGLDIATHFGTGTTGLETLHGRAARLAMLPIMLAANWLKNALHLVGVGNNRIGKVKASRCSIDLKT
jgi:hypothetical protein